MPTPSDHPQPTNRQYKQALLYLMHNAESASEEGGDRFDSINRIVEKTAAFLARIEGSTDPRVIARAIAEVRSALSKIARLAKKGLTDSAKAADMAESARDSLDRSEVSIGDLAGEPPTVLGAEVHSVVLRTVIRNPEGKVSQYDFFINGTRHRFSGTQGALLEALCAKEGASTDHYVPFKTRQSLEEILGVDASVLRTRVNRLRDTLADRYGFSRDLLETDRARGYRLRLARKSPSD